MKSNQREKERKGVLLINQNNKAFSNMFPSPLNRKKHSAKNIKLCENSLF